MARQNTREKHEIHVKFCLENFIDKYRVEERRGDGMFVIFCPEDGGSMLL
jgi:hypothetical protein